MTPDAMRSDAQLTHVHSISVEGNMLTVCKPSAASMSRERTGGRPENML